MESDTKFERIGGSSMGGGTFWGLGSILTKAKVSVCCFGNVIMNLPCQFTDKPITLLRA